MSRTLSEVGPTLRMTLFRDDRKVSKVKQSESGLNKQIVKHIRTNTQTHRKHSVKHSVRG